MDNRSPLSGVAAVALGLLLSGVGAAPSGASSDLSSLKQLEQPVVVELYTSQGCSSCPPADALLTELAAIPGVIPLSLHVDYWDYIGWKDTFASPINTARQKDYAKSLAGRYIYTPQMVIDGRFDVIGSRRSEVARTIEKAAKQQRALQLEVVAGDPATVIIPAGEAPPGGATVWLAIFDKAHETEIRSGENRGRNLVYSNVVRELEKVGEWNGKAMEIKVDLVAAQARGRAGCVIIVQEGRAGPILGALVMDVPGAS